MCAYAFWRIDPNTLEFDFVWSGARIVFSWEKIDASNSMYRAIVAFAFLTRIACRAFTSRICFLRANWTIQGSFMLSLSSFGVPEGAAEIVL